MIWLAALVSFAAGVAVASCLQRRKQLARPADLEPCEFSHNWLWRS